MLPIYTDENGERQTGWKTPFNHSVEAEAKKTALYCKDPSLAQQNARDEVDINTIVNRFMKTGQMPQIPLPPQFGEYPEDFNFQDAMNTIAAANYSFAMLPAEQRSAFGNDPMTFVATVDQMLTEQDPKKRDRNLEILRAMNMAVTPGPVADATTLGDVLRAIKEQGTPPAPPAPPNGAS